jgi:excisionase family DNA binding protein
MTERPEADPWLTYAQAAEHVGANHQTIRRAVRLGQLPVSRVSKRLVRIRRSWLDAWMNASRTVSDTQ